MKNSKLHTTEDKSNEKVTSSNSKSEDTPRMIDVHRKQLRAQRWLQNNTHEGGTPEDKFNTELRALINKHSKEGASDTPDFVLADYLTECLRVFDYTVRYRESTKDIVEPAEWGGVGEDNE